MSNEELAETNNIDNSNSQIDRDGEEEEEEQVPDVTLNEELLSKNLKLLARTANGVSFAFTRLEIHDENLCDIDILQKFKHLRYVVGFFFFFFFFFFYFFFCYFFFFFFL